MAGTTVTFVKDLVSVSVPGPPHGTETASLPRYVSSVSAGHKRWSYTLVPLGDQLNQWTIQLDALTASQKADLQEFFDLTADGPNNTFTYTHTDGTSYSDARFVDTELRWSRANQEFWSTMFRIETGQAIS